MIVLRRIGEEGTIDNYFVGYYSCFTLGENLFALQLIVHYHYN